MTSSPVDPCARTRTVRGQACSVGRLAPAISVEAAVSTHEVAISLLHHCRGGVCSGGSRLQLLPPCSELMSMVMRAMPTVLDTISVHQESSWNALQKRQKRRDAACLF